VSSSPDDARTPPRLAARAGVAVLFAVAAGAICWRAQYVAHALGGDYLILWRATHIVLDGGDPYRLMGWMDLPALHSPFYYPLPAIGMGLPFAWLGPQNAAIAFIGCSAGLLGFALTRSGFERVPLLLSIPFIFVSQLSQTSFLILALALIPACAGLTVFKPNIGLALFAWRPRWSTALTGGALIAGATVIAPMWPAEWLGIVRVSPVHRAPIATGVGAVALLAILRWRRPEARLLIAMALLPHGLYFYDELPLWLVASSSREALLLTGASWAGWLLWLATSSGPGAPHLRDAAPWLVATLYIPCTWLILRRPNVGRVPAIVERAVEHLPPAVRGAPAGAIERAL
jgi:hypothetical protein